MNPWLKRLAIAIPVLVVLFFGGVLLYANVIRDDAPASLSTDDLDRVVAGTAAATASGPASTAAAPAEAPAATTAATVSSTEPAGPAGSASAAAAAGDYDGTWVATADSELGYRVEEVLFGVNTTAAGRSNQVTGELTIAGTSVATAEFSVDVATIVSDDERRDSQFRGNIMQIDQFPTATFSLTEPIELGALPAADEQVTATATGDLTLHGVTRSVTFDVTAQAAPGRIGVLGNIPVTFADYDIDNPSRSGISVEDDGLLEFVLVFAPA